jgi:uncharacterized Zn finger protein
MCPVCSGESFRVTTWKTATGSHWPALECAQCGALTRDMHVQQRATRSSTIVPPASKRGAGSRAAAPLIPATLPFR